MKLHKIICDRCGNLHICRSKRRPTGIRVIYNFVLSAQQRSWLFFRPRGTWSSGALLVTAHRYSANRHLTLALVNAIIIHLFRS